MLAGAGSKIEASLPGASQAVVMSVMLARTNSISKIGMFSPIASRLMNIKREVIWWMTKAFGHVVVAPSSMMSGEGDLEVEKAGRVGGESSSVVESIEEVVAGDDSISSILPVSSKVVSGSGRKDCGGFKRRLSLKHCQVVATEE